MQRLLVDSIAWERVNLIIDGHVEPAGLTGPVRLHVEDARTGQRITLPDTIPDAEGRFTVRFKIMQANELMPLDVGDWMLFAEQGADRVRVLMAPEFVLDAVGYPGMFTATYRYWVFPEREPHTGQFYLAINYRGALPVQPKSMAEALQMRLAKVLRQGRQDAYRLVYELVRAVVPKNGRRILFTSDSRDHLSGNLRHIYERMQQRGLDRDYRLMGAFKASITDKRGIIDKFTFAAKLAVADVVIMDDYHPMTYKVDYDAGVRRIQVWHASGAFKTVGYSRIGKPGGPSPFSFGHKNYTHAIVAAQHDVPFYAEAYGIPEERVIPTGIPRLDLFFDEEYKSKTRAAVYEAVPMARDRYVILFAPTFRGDGPRDAYYDYDELDLPALYELCEELDAVVVFKMHPFVLDPLVIPAEYADRFIDATTSREINEFLLIADLAITDYSSLVFEYSILDRPMLFFAYDLEEYISTRDFYERFEDFVPGRIVRTFGELLQAVRDRDFEQEKVRTFAETHLGHLDGGSTDRVIDQLILGRDEA